jgi:hypothetical protein
MMPRPPTIAAFSRVIENAIDLVGDRFDSRGRDSERLPILLSRCEAMIDQCDSRPKLPIRVIHHFACSGGTLISKCIAASPNTCLFSEINPLGTHHFSGSQRPFFPTDLMADLHYSPRPLPLQFKIDYFTAGLTSLYRNLSAIGQHVVVRDHSHSHFCVGTTVPERPTLTSLVRQVAPVRAILTVRHPLESFASLQSNKWVHFTPGTMTTYCHRYQAFLDTHADVPLFRYENFVNDPPDVLSQMLTVLDLQPVAHFAQLASLFRLSGDSGRGGEIIAPRQRRQNLKNLLVKDEDPAPYIALCTRLQYEP